MGGLLHDWHGRRQYPRHSKSKRTFPRHLLQLLPNEGSYFRSPVAGATQPVRAETRASRAKATNLEELLFRCYDSYFHFVESIEGAMDFIGRNQHHIRSHVAKRDRALVSSLIIAAGAEAVFRLNREPRASMKYLRDFLPKFMLNGLTGWNASAAAKPSA
jgi:hypothetical protein